MRNHVYHNTVSLLHSYAVGETAVEGACVMYHNIFIIMDYPYIIVSMTKSMGSTYKKLLDP